jgi:integral membrane protein (TIGR01906 family)
MVYLKIITRWVFIICVPLLLLSASIACAANSLWLYRYCFTGYDVSEDTGIDDAQLEKAAETLIRYFNSGDEYVDIVVEKDGEPMVLFNEEETIHMKDVKELFRLDYQILLITLLYVIYYIGYFFFRRRGQWRELANTVLWGSGVTLGIMLALWVGMLLDFDRLFLQFHLLSFTNDYWSASGYMVRLFPSGFWYDAALLCAVGTAGAAALIGIVSVIYLIFYGKTLHLNKQVS